MGVLGELDELATKGGKVRIAEVLDDFGKRSFGPFIMLPALIEITPWTVSRASRPFSW